MIESLESLKAKIQAQQARLNEAVAKADELSSPFHLRIQKDKKRLEMFEKQQKQTFMVVVKRRFPFSSREWNINEEFASYFMGFLSGEFKSINDFFIKKKGDFEVNPLAMFHKSYVNGRNSDSPNWRANHGFD